MSDNGEGKVKQVNVLCNVQAQAVLLQIMGLATYQCQSNDLAWLGYEQGVETEYWCIVISRQGQSSDYKILQQIFAGMHTQLVALGHEKACAINNNKGLYIWDFGQISLERVSSIQQQDNFEYIDFFSTGMIKETGACVIGLPSVQTIAQSAELRQALWSYLLQVE